MVAHAASAADVRISLLGGFSVVVDGRPVAEHWRLRKAKTLVKLLALAPGHRLHRESVVEALWPDAPQQRLLVLGTARREELVPGHPVAEWLVGLRSEGSLVELDLEPLPAAETAQLAAQVVRRDLNQQSASRLYEETKGNPLYVVEMASAGLGAGARKRWSQGRDFSDVRFGPADLPPRMYGVIAGRLAQLSPEARELADLAAVVGRVCTVEILRAASGSDSDTLTERLDELWHRRILRAVPQRSADSPTTGETSGMDASDFDFSHDKLRDVAYAELSPIKRRSWHARIAWAIETVHAADLDLVSAQLAAHHEQAGNAERAVVNYQRAAEVAQRVYAHDEAVALLRRGLALLDHLPDQRRRGRQERDLMMLLSLSLVATRGYGAPEVLDALSRVQLLHAQLDEPPAPPLLRALAIAVLNRGDFGAGHNLGEQLLQLAHSDRDAILRVEAHYVLGVTHFWLGSFTTSRTHLEQALAGYDPAHSAAHISRYSQDPQVICLSRLAFSLLCLGYPEQATAIRVKGLTRARAMAHPFSLAYAMTWAAMLHGAMRDFAACRRSAEGVMKLDHEHPSGLWSSWARVLRGWALAETGQRAVGTAELQRGGEQMRATGGLFLQPFVAALVAEQLSKSGDAERGLALLDQTLTSASSLQSWCDAELHRLRGGLLLALGIEDEAEAAYHRAIRIARGQRARLFELRATTDLARQRVQQGRGAECRAILTPIYSWFTEGHDTPDLIGARAVLNIASTISTRATTS
jgi:predicted ATPase